MMNTSTPRSPTPSSDEMFIFKPALAKYSGSRKSTTTSSMRGASSSAKLPSLGTMRPARKAPKNAWMPMDSGTQNADGEPRDREKR
jgi:hypothetical protein